MYRLIPIQKKILKICITGHRNIYGYDWKIPGNTLIFKRLMKTIESLITTSGYDTFIFTTGGALLVDQMAATVIIFLRKKYRKEYTIRLIIAVPFKDQPNKWYPKDIQRYNSHLKVADKVIYVDKIKGYQKNPLDIGRYNKEKLAIRNKLMVDVSDVLIAVYDDTKIKSGTHLCIEMAKNKGLYIIYIDPNLPKEKT